MKDMPEDVELLRRYVREKSDTAFAELVRRHNGARDRLTRALLGDAARDHTALDLTISAERQSQKNRHEGGSKPATTMHL